MIFSDSHSKAEGGLVTGDYDTSSAYISLPSFIRILGEPSETAFSCPEFMFVPHTSLRMLIGHPLVDSGLFWGGWWWMGASVE